MKDKKIKSFTLGEMKNKYIGELGTESRTRYEAELNKTIILERIRLKIKLYNSFKINYL